DRGNEMMAAFPGMTSVAELQGGNGNQFFPPALGPGSENNWAQDFAVNFPPLPEPGNSGSLVALSSPNGQFSYNNQPDFGQPSFSSQPNFGRQQPFASKPGFSHPPFGGQKGYG